ncbi:Protein of unknown function, partial [Gryllus bimaculatus]
MFKSRLSSSEADEPEVEEGEDGAEDKASGSMSPSESESSSSSSTPKGASPHAPPRRHCSGDTPWVPCGSSHVPGGEPGLHLPRSPLRSRALAPLLILVKQIMWFRCRPCRRCLYGGAVGVAPLPRLGAVAHCNPILTCNLGINLFFT